MKTVKITTETILISTHVLVCLPQERIEIRDTISFQCGVHC